MLIIGSEQLFENTETEGAAEEQRQRGAEARQGNG